MTTSDAGSKLNRSYSAVRCTVLTSTYYYFNLYLVTNLQPWEKKPVSVRMLSSLQSLASCWHAHDVTYWICYCLRIFYLCPDLVTAWSNQVHKGLLTMEFLYLILNCWLKPSIHTSFSTSPLKSWFTKTTTPPPENKTLEHGCLFSYVANQSVLAKAIWFFASQHKGFNLIPPSF